MLPLSRCKCKPAFASFYRCATPGLKRAIRSKVFLFADRFTSNPADALGTSGRVKGLGSGLIEVDIDKKRRAIAKAESGFVVFLRAGDHDLIAKQRYTRDMLQSDLHDRTFPIADVFGHELVLRERSASPDVLEKACEERWLYELDTLQMEAVLTILDAIENKNSGPKTFVVYGGPGTGKTSVLLQIADLLEWDPTRVQLTVSDELAAYIRAGIGPEIDECRCNLNLPSADVLLIDDPNSWKEVSLSCVLAGLEPGGTRVRVIAIDLAQLTDIVRDDTFSDWEKRYGTQPIALSRCYRQKQALGRQAVHFMNCITERFSKFQVRNRILSFNETHQLQSRLMNDMSFAYPGGYCEIYEPATRQDLAKEVAAICRTRRWLKWPPLLAVVESDQAADKFLGDKLRQIDHRRVTLDAVQSIRGLEFQHVFIVLSSRRLREIEQGRCGLGTAEYVVARNMRIPFSRATDRLVLFALE